MSILNVNKINPVGSGSTITITGIASVTNSISVGNSVTASSFHGDVTGNATGLSGSPTIDVSNVTAGIVTANSLSIADGTTSIDKHAVGVGTTTTAGRNAGVSTATGTIIYNTNFNALQVYTGSAWNVINTKTPDFAIHYLVVGGGGGGGGSFRGGGGGGGGRRSQWANC